MSRSVIFRAGVAMGLMSLFASMMWQSASARADAPVRGPRQAGDPAEPEWAPLDPGRAKRTDAPGETERALARPRAPTTSTPTFSGHESVVALSGARGLVCTGTLVAPRIVLTARHCLPVREVRFGVDPRSPFSTVKVASHRAPPLGVLDIALLELEAPSKVKPMPLRPAKDRSAPIGVLRLVGFGATDVQGERGMTLRHLVDVQSRGWSCEVTDEGRTGCLSGLEMVIGRQGNNDACTRDSGGPVLESVDGQLRVVAVTARQLRGSVLTCGDGGIYTRVDAVGEWLTKTIREMGGKK